MANDRVHIKCKGCGAWQMLLKYDGLALHPSDKIMDWLAKHGERCHGASIELDGDPRFELYTDDDVGGALEYAKQNADPP